MKRKDFIRSIAMLTVASNVVPISSWAKDMKEFSETGSTMPVLFVGHGSPMNAILDNDFTRAVKSFRKNLPAPKAILMISAHWLTRGTFVQASPQPKMIYDMYGFPDELYQISYPAPGSPALAREVQNSVKGTKVELDHEWGFDHGCWMVLKLMYPEAVIPVFQMSIDINKPATYHYQLAKELSDLRKKGILIIGSGNIVHNLGRVDFADINAKPYDWALEFDSFVKTAIDSRNDGTLLDYQKSGNAATLAVPTPDHYYPLIYILGLSEKNEKVTYPYEGIQHASVSMRCVKIG